MNYLKQITGIGFIAVLFFGILAMSCENDTNSDDTKGTLRVIMTDAPFPGDMVEAANVTINKVEIRKAGEYQEEEQNEGEGNEDEGQDNGNPFVVLSEEKMSMNLLDLRNGVTQSLAELEIEQGDYDLVRLYVEDASIKMTDGKTYNLTVPSGAQTGIKVFIEPALTVAGGLSSELLLDFDVSKSFVAQGNLNSPAGVTGFIFKPVIRATNNSTAGRITGTVTDSAEAVGNAQVWVEQDTVVATTFTEESGDYQLIGLPEGAYDLFATKTDMDTISVPGVEVVGGNKITKDLSFTEE